MRRFVLPALLAIAGITQAPAQVLQAPQAAAARAPSAADFADPPFLSNPALSPDGRKLAVAMTEGDQLHVAIYEVGKWDEPIRRLRVGSGMALRSFRWVGDDRLVISTLAIRLLMGLPLPITRLIAFAPSSGHSMPLGNSRGLIGDSVIYVDRAGRYLLLQSQKSIFEDPGVERVDLVTGQAEWVQRPRGGVESWFADAEGVIRAGVDYGEKRLKIHYRTAHDTPWTVIRTKTLDDETVVESLQFAADPTKGVIVTNGRTGRFAAYHYDFAAQAFGAPIFEHPTVDVDELVTNSHASGVDGVTYEDDRPRTFWINPEYKAIQQRIDKALPNSSNEILDRSRDGNRVLFSSASAIDPGSYYIYDQARKRIELFATPFARIHPELLSDVKIVRYKARDGLEIPAYLTLPRNSSGKGLPLVLLPHGGPFARDHWGYEPFRQFLASRGYAVLQPQFRGSTGRGRSFVEAGHGQWGLKMQDDLDDGLDWAVREGIVDPKRVCIMGISYGGYAAMWGAIRNPERYRCGISLAGVADLKAMLKYDARFLLAKRYVPRWRSKVAGHEKRDLAAVSPLQQAQRLRVPLLVAHGEQDQNVPVEQSRKMVDVLKSRPGLVEPIFYPKSKHGVTTKEDIADFLSRLEAFLRKHNPA